MSENNLAKLLSYVKVILGISWSDQDDILKWYIKTSYMFIAKQTGVYFLKDDPAEIAEIFDGEWTRNVWLSKAPATARNKLEYNAGDQDNEDRTTIDRDWYILQSKRARLTYLSWFPRGFQNMKATYTVWYDWDDVPAEYEDLKFAVAKLVWVAKDLVAIGAIRSETVSWTTIQYTQEFKDSGVQQIINLYSNFWM